MRSSSLDSLDRRDFSSFILVPPFPLVPSDSSAPSLPTPRRTRVLQVFSGQPVTSEIAA